NAVAPVNKSEENRKDDFITLDEKPTVQNEESEIECKSKKESWIFSDMYTAFEDGKFEEAERIFNQYALNEKDMVKLEETKAAYLYFKFEKGKDISAIDELENLLHTAKNETSKFNYMMWLSFCFESSLEHKKEIELWEKARLEMKDPSLVTKTLVCLASALNKDNQSNRARALLVEHLSKTEENAQKSKIYDSLSIIEASLGNKIISVYCKDKSLEFAPHNREELFNAAYSASDNDIDEISISNYLRLIRIDSKNAIALNNLGVRAQEAGIKTVAVENYKKSAKLNNTLAMANQGYLLLDAGFTDEAEEIVKQALCLDDVHQNIHSLKIAINERKEIQRKGWETLSEKSFSRQKSIREYIGQYYLGDPKKIQGDWFVNGTYLTTVDVKNNLISAIWEEPALTQDNNKYTVMLTGVISGTSFSGTYSRTLIGDKPKGLLMFSSNTNKAFIGFISDGDEKLTLISQNANDDFSLFLSKIKHSK
ncbi:TPA: hypothetical protein SIA29_002039, partial [Aeromonas sobria]|nr:hypothetical protein [Aeromonas sobria]HEH9431206.1 hypothetical protein [Aeromonas sobria]